MRRAVVVAIVAGCKFTAGAPATDGQLRDASSIDARMIDAPAIDASVVSSFVIEAESYTATGPTSTHSWAAVTDVSGYSGTALMQIVPNNGEPCDVTMLGTCGTELDFTLAIVQPATYHVFVRMWAATSADDSLWYGFDGTPDATPLQPAHDSSWHWVAGDSFLLSAGSHTLSLWQREAGARADVVAVSTSATPPP